MTPFLLQDVFIEWLTGFDVGASAEYQGLQHEDPTMDEPLRRLGTTVYDNLGALFFFGGAQSNPEDPSESPEIVLCTVQATIGRMGGGGGETCCL